MDASQYKDYVLFIKYKAKRKAAQEDLDKKINAKYPTLTEAEIKALVLDDKWMARLQAAVQGELDRVSQTITGRIRELAERYRIQLWRNCHIYRPRIRGN
jgi:type I restriction enzyme M protein